MRAFLTSGMLGCALVAACSRPVEPALVARPRAPTVPAPVAAPRPGILGCVESPELKEYVRALEAQRASARQAALAALGATSEERPGVLGDPGAPLGRTLTTGGQRFAVVAELAAHFEPRATLARRGHVLQRIDERPRSHPVPVLACGVQGCPSPRPPGRAPVRPLLVELAPGESWNEQALGLGYDFWWADVRYPEREACEPPAAAPASLVPVLAVPRPAEALASVVAPAAPAAPSAESLSAASATP